MVTAVVEAVYRFLWGDLFTIPLGNGNGIGIPLLVLLLIPTGVYFTIRTRFLPTMSDIEVYVHDDELNQDVWKRVFIGGGTEKRICGLRHPDLTSGVHARIRG